MTYEAALRCLLHEGYSRVQELSSGHTVEIEAELQTSPNLERNITLERRGAADAVFIVLPWYAPAAILEARRLPGARRHVAY